MTDPIIFHLAIPVNNIPEAKEFYVQGLGCEVGRKNEQAMILNFYGHQVVCHVTKEQLKEQKGIYPRHFGLIFRDENDWEIILNRCHTNKLNFYQQAKLRFSGELTEHKTFFLQDPFYNFLEFKFYRHYEAIFGGRELATIGDRP
jgi:extradiol dioxygenase family protein